MWKIALSNDSFNFCAYSCVGGRMTREQRWEEIYEDNKCQAIDASVMS